MPDLHSSRDKAMRRRYLDDQLTVNATMRDTAGRNAPKVKVARQLAAEENVDLRTAELDVSSHESADCAVQQVLREAGHLDVVIHNAGPMVYGPRPDPDNYSGIIE